MKKLVFTILIFFLVSFVLADEIRDKRELKAAGLSLLVPGGGQLYNGKYLKSGLAFGTEATFLSLALYNYSQSEKFYDEYKESGFQADLEKYNDYYDKKQNYFFWLGISVFAFSVDAFVDAHLQDYLETKNKIHLKFEAQSISINIKF
jgi:hypothetical protein